MSDQAQLIEITWRDEYEGLHGALDSQRRTDNFVNQASRVALAVLELYRDGHSLTPKTVVDYVHTALVPRHGWANSGPHGFNRAAYERLVWPVVAAMKAAHPGEALIYVS